MDKKFVCVECGEEWTSEELALLCARLNRIENSDNAYKRFLKRTQYNDLTFRTTLS